MRYEHLPGIDRPIAKLVLGTMAFNTRRAAEAFAVFDAYVALGGNCLDTAQVYGNGESERVIGQWLKARGNRESIVLLSKGAHPDAREPRVTPEAIEADLEASLARLGVDCIDIYLLHRDDPSVSVGPIVECLNAQKRRGRINVFGGSNWSTARLAEANAYAEAHGLEGFRVSSPNISLAKPNEPRWPGCVSLDTADLAWYEAHQFPAFSWSSQAGGFFTGRFSPEDPRDPEMVRVYYSAANWERFRRAQELAKAYGADANQMALAYVLNQPFPVFAIIGPLTPAELESSAQALSISLTRDQLRYLDLGG